MNSDCDNNKDHKGRNVINFNGENILNKKGILPNPQKRFRRFLKASKWVQSLKKRIKKSMKPLKVLFVYPWEEPPPAKPFLSSVQQKKVS